MFNNGVDKRQQFPVVKSGYEFGKMFGFFGKTYVTLREIYDPVSYFVLLYCGVWFCARFLGLHSCLQKKKVRFVKWLSRLCVCLLTSISNFCSN
jgi:hypothetical protein